MKQFRTKELFVLTRGVKDKRIATGCSIERVGVLADSLRHGTPYAIWQRISNKWVCVRFGVSD